MQFRKGVVRNKTSQPVFGLGGVPKRSIPGGVPKRSIPTLQFRKGLHTQKPHQPYYMMLTSLISNNFKKPLTISSSNIFIATLYTKTLIRCWKCIARAISCNPCTLPCRGAFWAAVRDGCCVRCVVVRPVQILRDYIYKSLCFGVCFRRLVVFVDISNVKCNSNTTTAIASFLIFWKPYSSRFFFQNPMFQLCQCV